MASSEGEKIVLYDLAQGAKPNRCWSYNVWKVRLALNYKKIPFTTVWVDHGTLAPTLKSIGTPPNNFGQGFEYTVPTIRLPDGSIIADSAATVSTLEVLYPSPALHVDADLQAEADRVVQMISKPLLTIYMPRIARDVIDEATVPAFTRSLNKGFEISLEELEKSKQVEGAWEAAKPGFNAMKQFLNKLENDEGPFIHGNKVCLAEFMLVAVFESLKRVGIDMFQRAIGLDSGFYDLYHASEHWVENDQ